jgi:hypothetical protein
MVAGNEHAPRTRTKLYIEAGTGTGWSVSPDRRTVAGPILDSLYFGRKMELIERIRAQQSFGISMDGWKKKTAESGTPIVTCMVLLPKGGSAFWKVSIAIMHHIRHEECGCLPCKPQL